MTVAEIINLLQDKQAEAENDSNRAAAWHAEALGTPGGMKAFYHVRKAATQHALLQHLIDEINGQSSTPLWEQ